MMERRMERLTRTELCMVAPEAILLIPLGATEQHGPHLAVGTDHLIASDIALRAAERLSDAFPVIVAPVIPVGVSEHHVTFGGTLSVSSETLLRLLIDLGTSAARSGFRRLFLLNGHGGNVEVAGLAARQISEECEVAVGIGSYWRMAMEQLDEAGASWFGNVPGHAGAFETSLVLALDPGLVEGPVPRRDDPAAGDLSRSDGPYTTYHPGRWTAMDGWSDDPSRACAHQGIRLRKAIVDAAVGHLTAFHASTRDQASTDQTAGPEDC